MGSPAPLKVLVAEADAAAARLLAWVLAQGGYDVEVALNGKAALEILGGARFDVLLCDWSMPDIDGMAIVRHVRANLNPQPLIITVAGSDRPGAKDQALRIGADGYIAKPFEPVVLLDTITAGLARRASAPVSTTSFTPATAPVILAAPSIAEKASVPPSSPISSVRSANVVVGRSHLVTLAATNAWRGLSKSVESTLQECVGRQFFFESASLCESGANLSSAVFMVNVPQFVEMAVALFVTWNSGVELARTILRDSAPDDVAIRELLTELGSNVLGTLKTAFRREGFAFTLGLGQPDGMPMASSFARAFSISWLGAFNASGIRFTTVVGARTARRSHVSVRKLRENMVLAEDLTNDAGAVVLQAGTRLTSSTAERLAQKLAHRSVNVCIPPTDW